MTIQYTKRQERTHTMTTIATDSYIRFPKKMVGGKMGEYCTIQSAFLDKDYAYALGNMLFLDGRTKYTKFLSNQLSNTVGVDSVKLTNGRIEADTIVTFEPEYDWSVRILFKSLAKVYDVECDAEDKKHIDKLRKSGVVEFPIQWGGFGSIDYDKPRNKYVACFFGRESDNGVTDAPRVIYVNIIPNLVDYVSVIKRMRSQIELSRDAHALKYDPSSVTHVCFINDFNNKHATFEDVETMMTSANIDLVSFQELQDFFKAD